MKETQSINSVTRIVSAGCISTAIFTALLAFVLLNKYEEELLAANMHLGMSFRWTILSLPGVGAIFGTVVGWIANYFVCRSLRRVPHKNHDS